MIHSTLICDYPFAVRMLHPTVVDKKSLPDFYELPVALEQVYNASFRQSIIHAFEYENGLFQACEL
jgi:hypothetical protein